MRWSIERLQRKRRLPEGKLLLPHRMDEVATQDQVRDQVQDQVQDVRRSDRERKQTNLAGVYAKSLPGGSQSGAMLAIDYEKYAHLSDDPQTIQEVRVQPDAELWERSINDELASLVTKQVYDVVELPQGMKTLPVRWVFKVYISPLQPCTTPCTTTWSRTQRTYRRHQKDVNRNPNRTCPAKPNIQDQHG